jgi:uncharacterized membrane protein
MPLDGLRAWIGEVERKLGMRTRVFLVLATIAIGGAGAAIYLALDTRADAVSESDVRELQEQLEERIGAGGVEAEEEAGAGDAEGAPEVPDSAPADEGGIAPGDGSTPSPDNLKELLEEARKRSEEARERAEQAGDAGGG